MLCLVITVAVIIFVVIVDVVFVIVVVLDVDIVVKATLKDVADVDGAVVVLELGL